MAMRKSDPKLRKIHGLMDEVYREMLRLEAGYPGAEMGLALALLRSWVALDPQLHDVENWAWFKNICPICLNLIEMSLKRDGIALGCSAKSCCPK